MTTFSSFGKEGKAGAADVGSNFFKFVYIRLKVEYIARTVSSFVAYFYFNQKRAKH